MTPNLNNLRAGNADCPSDFALDRLHSGGCAEDEAARLNSHIATCKQCESRMSERRAGFDALSSADPVKMLAAIRRGIDDPKHATTGEKLLRWTRRFLAPVLMVSAASLILYSRYPTEMDGPKAPAPDSRAKGGLALHVFHQVGTTGEEVPNGATIGMDDRLRFAVDLPKSGTVSVLGLEDKHGDLFTAWPLDPSASTLLTAGTNIELPGAVQLDGLSHGESFFLVECTDAARISQCHAQDSRLICPAGCQTTSFALEKKRPESAEP